MFRYALQRFSPRKKGVKGVDGTHSQEGDNRVNGVNGVEESRAKAESKPPAEIHLVEPKTKKSRRTIDLPQVTLSALAAHQMRQAEERRLAGSRWTVPMVHCEGRLDPAEDFSK